MLFSHFKMWEYLNLCGSTIHSLEILEAKVKGDNSAVMTFVYNTANPDLKTCEESLPLMGLVNSTSIKF